MRVTSCFLVSSITATCAVHCSRWPTSVWRAGSFQSSSRLSVQGTGRTAEPASLAMLRRTSVSDDLRQIAAARRQFRRQVNANPTAQRLKTTPGMVRILGHTILAEIGLIERFAEAKRPSCASRRRSTAARRRRKRFGLGQHQQPVRARHAGYSRTRRSGGDPPPLKRRRDRFLRPSATVAERSSRQPVIVEFSIRAA